MNRVHVLQPGALTTVQDLGRPGYQRHGLTPGGAMDRQACRIANLLVGNPESAAGLEITMAGPRLRFEQSALVAVGGATVRGVRSWTPFRVQAGEVLSLEKIDFGWRAYVAVAGGFAVPETLGGVGTDLRAHFGGHEGRALRAGDALAVGESAAGVRRTNWRLSPAVIPAYSKFTYIRAVLGPQWDWFEPETQRRFFAERHLISPQSDRMGIRLAGPPLKLREPREMTSEAVAFGAVQVPPNGQPIVLMADRQTIGGYPKIAHVISVDLPLLAQLRPGNGLIFREVSLEQAQTLYLANERALARLKEGLSQVIG